MMQFETATETIRLERPEAERPRTVFFADCHLCADDSAADRQRQRRVVRFLQTIDPASTALYIVGDLFDFWFTYRRSIPARGFAVLAQLSALRDAGTPITFIAGNHDYWAIPFLRDELGLETFDRPLARTLLGRRVWMAHGDGLGSGDYGYKLLKRLLRNRLAIGLYRLLHPDLGIALASSSSRLSREQGDGDQPAHVERLYAEVARPAFEAGHQLVILGHTHLPTLREDGDRSMVVLGDWISSHTYLSLEGDRLSLHRFNDDGAPGIVAERRLPPRPARPAG